MSSKPTPVLLSGDGACAWTVRWRYVWELRIVPKDTAALELKYPKNLQLQMEAVPVPGFGEIILPPG
jgi:hypothetical protein